MVTVSEVPSLTAAKRKSNRWDTMCTHRPAADNCDCCRQGKWCTHKSGHKLTKSFLGATMRTKVIYSSWGW